MTKAGEGTQKRHENKHVAGILATPGGRRSCSLPPSGLWFGTRRVLVRWQRVESALTEVGG